MNRVRNRVRHRDRWLSRIRRVWMTAGLLFTVVFTGWSLWAYGANTEAHDALVSDNQVMVQHDDGVWSFVPTGADSSRREGPALVFFPGALVDPVASTVASQQRPGFSGLVLIGTSHPRDVDLSGLRVPVTKIVGTHDGLASRAEVETNRNKLPLSTRWEWIEGGNHSQFGWYGFQPGDRWPHITAAAQRDLMIRRVLDMLADVTGQPPSLPLS
jgi:pimeloyl-ACP methyl ester carboxylesterase